MENIIEVNDLHYSYPPQTPGDKAEPVLTGINLKIKKGEFVSIMGPTGAGKTTFCLTLNGIVPHSTKGDFHGEVLVDGLNTNNTAVVKMAQKVGIVFQDPESQLFNMTVEDEIAFGMESLGVKPAEIDRRIEQVLKVVRMEGFRKRSPFHLSGGQKQRVAIASVLAMEPEVIILDEPTSGLDPVGKMEVFSVVEMLRRERQMTIIMIEQESERVADFSDRVFIMSNGRIELAGPPREVFYSLSNDNPYGVAIPQVVELACKMNKLTDSNYNFVTREEALKELAKEVVNKHE